MEETVPHVDSSLVPLVLLEISTVPAAKYIYVSLMKILADEVIVFSSGHEPPTHDLKDDSSSAGIL